MHKYLRAIGFSNLIKKRDLEKLIQICVKDPTNRYYVTNQDDTMLAVYCKEFLPDMGIAVCGEYDEDNRFSFDYSFPYLVGDGITSYDDITVERHAEKESYAGICDDVKVGVTLIFYLQNMIEYVKERNNDSLPIKGTSLTLSGLSCSGSIMMPILKDDREKSRNIKETNSRNQLIEAARRGDEEAIESLTLEDMDTYTSISKKIQKDDVFTLVDTYFMPYGVECDQYSVLGEIVNVSLLQNRFTQEEIFKLTILCNELTFDVCINKIDLFGEPQVGRRFKGVIWLQGRINFPA